MITVKHIKIKDVQVGEKLMLNLNGVVSRSQFDNGEIPTNIVEVVCERVDSLFSPDGSRKVFRTSDGEVHSAKEFQYDYKGYLFKNEDEVVLWVY